MFFANITILRVEKDSAIKKSGVIGSPWELIFELKWGTPLKISKFLVEYFSLSDSFKSQTHSIINTSFRALRDLLGCGLPPPPPPSLVHKRLRVSRIPLYGFEV